MNQYSYRAINSQGKIIKGHLRGSHRTEIIHRLNNQKLDILTLRCQQSLLLRPSLHRQLEELFNLCFYMELFLRGGVPLLEGLQSLQKHCSTTWVRGILAHLLEDVGEGALLSEAMAKHPDFFDDLFCNIVRFGEQTGTLAQSFQSLRNHTHQKQVYRYQKNNSLRYPLFALSAILAALWSLFTFLIPPLVDFLTAQNIPLPWATRSLIIFGSLLSWTFLPLGILGIGIVVLGLLLVRWYPLPGFYWYMWLLQLPRLGNFLKKKDLAPALSGLALMLQHGGHLLPSLASARRVLTNPFLIYSFQQAEKDILAGAQLSAAFDKQKLIPKTFLQLIRAGEKTGNLSEVILQISTLYDAEIKRWTERFIDYIEPIMICVLGSVLLWIAAGTLLPIYDSFEYINAF